MGIRGIRIRAFAGLLSIFSVVAPAFADTAAPAAAATANALSHIRIDNFGRVNDNFYRGAQPKGSDYTDLAALGVKTVIDLQEDGPSDESGIVQRAGMRFFRIPMTTSDPPTRGQIAQFFTIVNEPANQPVYVHCAGGRHRTGTMTALYRITNDGWTANQAYGEMKQYHFEGFFGHPALKNFVFAYRPAPASQGGALAPTGGQPK
jgi:protein tyrosine/serine phosphatase